MANREMLEMIAALKTTTEALNGAVQALADHMHGTTIGMLKVVLITLNALDEKDERAKLKLRLALRDHWQGLTDQQRVDPTYIPMKFFLDLLGAPPSSGEPAPVVPLRP